MGSRHPHRRAPMPRRPLPRWFWLAAGLALSSACADSPGAPADCPTPLDVAALASGQLPAPPAPLWPAPTLVADPAAPDTALLVDPAPLHRGEHPGLRLTRAPETCQITSEHLALFPPQPPTGDRPAPQSPLAHAPGTPRRLHALLVTGDDPGALDDTAAWRPALDLLGAAGETLHAPDRARFEAAVATLCADLAPEDTALLVTTGAATPTSGGALLLGDEAISYARIGALLAAHCATAALRIWVLDASYATDLSAALVGNAPLLLWRASEATHPDAPRLRPSGGGLLSHALAAHVARAATARCAAIAQPAARELADIFTGESDVVADMLAARWLAVGAPALAAADLGLDDTSNARERLAAALAAATPANVHLAIGSPGLSGGCASSADCRFRAAACGLPTCQTLTCESAACVPAVALAFPCDDDSPCTSDDRCTPAATCEGTPVQCDDANPCTLDICHPALGCTATALPAGAPCDDADVCTLADRCDPDGLCAGAAANCDDNNPCTDDRCDPIAGCLHAPSKSPCDDGDPCTQQDFCLSGLCSGDPVPCADGLPCTADTCDPALGCVNPPLPDGLPCDDGQPCTLSDRCDAGACKGSDAPCDDGLDCTLDLCLPTGCQNLPPPQTCATAAGCIPVGAHPADAPCLICASTATLAPDPTLEAAPCPDDGIDCTLDRCVAGTCTHTDQPGFCHTPDGTCVPAGELLSPCLVCEGGGVATATPPGTPCDSGDPCSGADVCTASGACTSIAAGCCTALEQAQCGVDLSGDTSLPGTPDLVSAWSCLTVAPFPAPEHTLRFVAPCTGVYTVQYLGLPGQLLFTRALPDGEPPCVDGACDAYAAGTSSVVLGTGQTLLLTVDGNGQTMGPYSLRIDCPCASDLGETP
jgi:hypothetical protein